MKLNKLEKRYFKDMKAAFGDMLITASFGRVTFALVKTGPNRGHIAWAICGEDEKKFSKKWGRFVAMDRLYNGIHMPIECVFEDMEYTLQKLDDLAYNLTY